MFFFLFLYTHFVLVLFFKELEAASSAALYMPVGALGRLFLAVEAEAFEMAA